MTENSEKSTVVVMSASASPPDPSFKIGGLAAFLVTYQLSPKPDTYQRISVFRKSTILSKAAGSEVLGLNSPWPLEPEFQVTVDPTTGHETVTKGSMISWPWPWFGPTEISVLVEQSEGGGDAWKTVPCAQPTNKVYKPYQNLTWFPEFFCATVRVGAML
ncbi:hypothetical protein SISSUDRAFT_707830 [Sistotremastrum suecicum HHB10207 ss-3]|uniref:Uncharacterized protein n=1 Tax=Sistotremastrum suecicum HHB10207 ss-3 TaxID=1314776 RepID=A0A166DU27_9AGAM|nr:hypothetical protein SISSUDRAFT_707830 [Sistotremastrum suecicum HHB10207 ss-3]